VWSDRQRRAFLAVLRHLARWLPVQQRDLEVRLRALEVPTAVVWGELDQVNAVENGRALVDLQPAARLLIVPGGGHNLQQEHPEAVLAAIADGAS
jgi:pimeloyl-ACP methyl ester carboxylesterase